MTSKQELLDMYEDMVADGEIDLLCAELSESQRLKQLYEERLQHLLDRNPALVLVSEGCDQMYDHYEQHFRYKIEYYTDMIEAATTTLSFKSPPRRSKSSLRCDAAKDSFMMDFENSCLANKWGSRPHPKGDKRHLDRAWAIMIQSRVYPHHSDVDWYEYVDWVFPWFW